MDLTLKHQIYCLHRVSQGEDAFQIKTKVTINLFRVSKLYKEMSKFIGTRNALQCRSHHQKLEDRYLYPNKIIANFKQHNNLTLYGKLKQKLEDLQNNNSVLTSSDLKL